MELIKTIWTFYDVCCFSNLGLRKEFGFAEKENLLEFAGEEVRQFICRCIRHGLSDLLVDLLPHLLWDHVLHSAASAARST